LGKYRNRKEEEHEELEVKGFGEGTLEFGSSFGYAENNLVWE
jgi:hypothetical protein